MINQMGQNENTQNQFSDAIRERKVGKLLRKANITKSCGISAYEVFQFLLLLVFQGKNLFRFLNSKRKDLAVSKNTYYRFLNDTSFNWTRFLLLLSAKVTNAFSALTRPERVKVLVLDGLMDTVLFQSASTFFLPQRKATAIRKYRIRLTTVPMATKPVRKAFCQSRKRQSV